ncbi:MAG TPA: hypothetical protein VN775_04805 [Opitutaceae bacterium]|nr:hypothetical protein [Opitutaceae bacterium]
MSNTGRISRRAWLIIPFFALAFTVVTTAIRVRRIEYVSEVAGSPAPAPERKSEWQPRLIVPGHHNESYEWLDQTRQMFARGEWRVRYVDYENVRAGHEVYASSPYRWWLGLLAWCHHGVTGAAIGASIEWAALYADPLLLLVFGAATTVFVARRFGALAAALASAALATLFPLAAEFLPGAPDDHGLVQACALWSVLPLLAGAASADGADAGRRARRWFFAGGVAGGIGLWISVSRQVPILLGIGLGGLMAAWIARAAARAAPSAQLRPLPWRIWALAGAATCLAAYLLEFFPSHTGHWEVRAIHPIFGLAWLGGGELLARTTAWIGGDRPRMSLRGAAAWVLGAAAFASLPVSMWIVRGLGFLSVDLPSMRLSLLPGGPEAPNLWAWLLQNGFTLSVRATVLPLLIVIPSVLLLFSPGTISHPRRVPIALALGPVLAAAGFAIRQIGWWNGVDAALIGLLVAAAAALRLAARPRLVAVLSAALAALVLLPGAFRLWPSAEVNIKEGLSESEIVGLIERDLAYWLAKHVGSAGAVVVAPPNETATLYYYGGIRGLASFGWEDLDGFQAAVRIASATTPEEAQELIGLHGATHIIMPSWDNFMDVFANIGEGQVAGTFLARLHQWNLPPWLRPVPYLMPTVSGFEGQSVVILEVVDEQDDATAASRLAEYFVDMGQLDLAAKLGRMLRRFPADLGALLARVQVATACGDNDESADTVGLLERRISGGADRDLPWDQRVALAVVLVQAHHADLARPRLRQCIAELDEEKLRSLSTILLYRLHVLRKALKLDISDPSLKALSLNLLPPDLRSRVE